MSQEVAGLQEVCSALFLEVNEMKEERVAIRKSKTLKGRFFNLVGHGFVVYCVYKMVMVSPHLPRQCGSARFPPHSRRAVCDSALSTLCLVATPRRTPSRGALSSCCGYDATTPSTATTLHLTHIAAAHQVLSVEDPEVWVQPASFCLVGGLVFSSVRGFLIQFLKVAS